MNLLDYICDYCDRSFTRKYNLQTHIENYHLNSSCYCQICDQRFGSPAGLQLHLSRGHNRFRQPFPECDHCGKIFKRKQNINSHMLTVHLQGIGPEIRCKICFKKFTTQRNLRRHTKLLHKIELKDFACEECHKVYKSNASLINHLQIVHKNMSFKCNLCNKCYSCKKNLKRHIEMHHQTKEEFKCNSCSKVYKSVRNLRHHTKAMHNYESAVEESIYQESNSNDSDTTYSCQSCGASFHEENLLRRHIKHKHSFQYFYEYCKYSLLKQAQKKKLRDIPEKNVLFYCEFCNYTFSGVYALKDHMKLLHDLEYCLSRCNVCFNKFYSKEKLVWHKRTCLPPPGVNSCSHCDKLFTDISSLEFHIKIFHPQAQIADTNVTSTNIDEALDTGTYKCMDCERRYYSERSLKHHIKLKHSNVEAMECTFCGKWCSNKYYLASHIKIVHNNDARSKCHYCHKIFKSKRNIRRHIEYTHLGMQRYKCVECETLFKEKRSLRKHVRSKHPNSTHFPQCHICYKRFESAKSCKIHLKLLHSVNMNTYPCDLCSVSFSCKESLCVHLQTKHLAEDEIYKCQECNLVFKGQETFERHNDFHAVNLLQGVKRKVLPRCVLCSKDFSTRKTLKRHIRNFHSDFDAEELVTFDSRQRLFIVECENCLRNLTDDVHYKLYQKMKYLRNSFIFKCESCSTSYNSLEYAIHRYKLSNVDASKTSKIILSDLCTTEMSDEDNNAELRSVHESIEPESTTNDMKLEPPEYVFEFNDKTEVIISDYVKTEPK